jgi:hypothetical protein
MTLGGIGTSGPELAWTSASGRTAVRSSAGGAWAAMGKARKAMVAALVRARWNEAAPGAAARTFSQDVDGMPAKRGSGSESVEESRQLMP